MNTQTSELFSLSDKVLLVTGGAGLLGQVFCQAFAESGAQVAIVDIDQPAAKSVADAVSKKSGQKASGFGCDITSPESVAKMVEAVVCDFGRIDVLVNNAASKS